jgi:hypothetical protein
MSEPPTLTKKRKRHIKTKCCEIIWNALSTVLEDEGLMALPCGDSEESDVSQSVEYRETSYRVTYFWWGG